MIKSDQINELAAALSKAQGAMSAAKKDSENPHFKSRYADLASVWDACRAVLAANGLSVAQATEYANGTVNVETMLMHTSGQFLSSSLVVPVSKPDAQGIGSAISYARRYSLSAMVGVSSDDDDGNAAVKQPPAAKPAPRTLADVKREHQAKTPGVDAPPDTTPIAFDAATGEVEDDPRTPESIAADWIEGLDGCRTTDDVAGWSRGARAWVKTLEKGSTPHKLLGEAITAAAKRMDTNRATVVAFLTGAA